MGKSESIGNEVMKGFERQPRKLAFLFAGGGTGGHLYPAVAIAEELHTLCPDAEIVFAGTKGKIEERVVPTRGYRFAPIWISGFRRKLTLETLLFPLKVIVATVQSLILIRKLRPAVVIGTGGYVCGPPVFAGTLLGVPTVIQEQNSYPGVTTRLLARRASEVHVTFESSRRYLERQDNVRVSGNPVRSAVGTVGRQEGIEFFRLEPGRTTLLVFGGSLGATSLNKAMVRILPEIIAHNVQVIWQTGQGDYTMAREFVLTSGDNVAAQTRVHRFIERMENAFAACDLALCRSGASTIAELTLAGIPSVLVPYPFAAADHQTENARTMVESGAAIMCKDRELETGLLPLVLGLLDDPARRQAMGKRAKMLAKPDAARTLAQAVLALVR
jgi:UDP-N-acetylglucosamine--N-acetylmuramyl-(pentapeptide) pyrophosphoryl-undecaprenol N-acetylglucosamine transferase